MSMLRHAGAAFVLAAMTAAFACGDSITLSPDQDATLYESDDGSLANGEGRSMFVGRTAQGTGVDLRRAVIRFDPSAIPAGSTIDAVTLRLVLTRTQAGGTPVTIHDVLTSWTEGPSNPGGGEGGGDGAEPGDVTWLHTTYESSFWSSAGGDYDATVLATTSVSGEGAYEWSSPALADSVQLWLDSPGTNHGWLIRGDESESTTAKRFGTRESPGADERPQLLVEFTSPSVTGACCIDVGVCVLRTETDCGTEGGTYLGDGTTCDGAPCGTIIGACCFPDGSCAEVSEAACVDAGGTYSGDGVACAPGLCPLVLEPYVDPLPRPAVAAPVSGEPGGVASYEIAVTEFDQQLHRDLPPTRVWGYGGSFPGPTIEASTDAPVTVTWINDLRNPDGTLRTEHYLPVDECLHGPDHHGPSARVVTHLHGGHVPMEFDGYPEWTQLPGESVVYEYPNQQLPATIWYHDHGLGITRLNVYMGLAGFYLIRDDVEAALGLPDGAYEVPIVFQDRSFNADGTFAYPVDWVDRFHGDFPVVNGKVAPYFEVTRGKYRLRLLNGSTSRLYNLSLSSGQPFVQIGTDGGLLPEAVVRNEILLTPGERADVIVDFEAFETGTEILVLNSAGAPGGEEQMPELMKIVVTGGAAFTDPVPATLRPIEVLDEDDASMERDFELAKTADECTGSTWLINGLGWDDITEYPELGDTEVWRWINRSGMVHPMHMHLVFFQVLDRQPFEVVDGEIVPIGDPVPPGPEEAGWKDTVAAHPFEITRVIARFEDYTGKFAYHCHILEHEDHEMMRQFEVVLPCPADVDNDGVVAVNDLLEVLAAWGPCAGCAADIDGDGAVGVTDLLEVLAAWGPCGG